MTASYVASGKSDQAQSAQQLDMQITLADEMTVSSTISIQYAYTWTNSCGPNSIKGGGSVPYTSRPGVYTVTTSTYGISVPLGVYGVSETKSELDTFNKCAKTDSTNTTGGFSLGVAVAGGAADLTTARSISGTQTFTRGAGCAIGSPEFGHTDYDACTLTITWNLTKPTCDPDLLEKANREYEVAQQFNEAAVKELEHAAEIMQETVGTYAKDSAVEHALTTALEKAAEHAAKTVGETIVADATMIGLIYELYKLYMTVTGELIPAAVEVRQLEKAALKDFQSAEAEAKKAKADLDKALAQGPCVGPARDELDKLLKEAAGDTKIRALVDSWQAQGSNYLYVVNNQLVDEAAAIRHARAILRGGRQLMSAESPRRNVSKQQIDKALVSVRHAVAVHAKTAKTLNKARSRDKTLHDRVVAALQ